MTMQSGRTMQQHIRAIFMKQLRKIDALDRRSDLQFTPTHDGGPHVEIQPSGELHLVVTERGSESSRRVARDVDQLVYWLMRGVVFRMACDYELKHRIPQQSFRRILFEQQLHLMKKLSRDWHTKLRDETDAILYLAPYDDSGHSLHARAFPEIKVSSDKTVALSEVRCWLLRCLEKLNSPDRLSSIKFGAGGTGDRVVDISPGGYVQYGVRTAGYGQLSTFSVASGMYYMVRDIVRDMASQIHATRRTDSQQQRSPIASEIALMGKVSRAWQEFMRQTERTAEDELMERIRNTFNKHLAVLETYHPHGWLRFKRTDCGRPHVEVYPNGELHYVITDAGETRNRKVTRDHDQLMYWLMRDVTMAAAHEQEIEGRVPGKDVRRQLFSKQLEMLDRMSSKWTAERQKEIDGILERFPYEDEIERLDERAFPRSNLDAGNEQAAAPI